MKQMFDVIVIGAGSGGLTAAVGFAKVGKRVLLIEREHIGGECTNSGCIPSKALLHHAKAYHHAISIAGTTTKSETYRQHAFEYVREKINEILQEETPEAFQKLGITVCLGEAVFTDARSLIVGNDTYYFKTAIIATGSAPRMIAIEGISPESVLTNQNIFALSEIPARTLILGGGPIGLEMGQAFSLLGSDVTVATTETEFAHLEDEAIRPIIQKKFLDQGIKIECEAYIQRVENGVAIFDRITTDNNKETLAVPFDKILIAIGRVPNIPKGLRAAGIQVSKDGVVVDSQYRTSNSAVYALGDVAQRLKFTHTADDVARQVVARVASKGLLRVTSRKVVPKVTYTMPEIAQVGLSWAAAKAKYGEDRLMRLQVPFTQSDRGKTDNDTSGHQVVIVKRLSGRILGAHIIAPAAGELISIFTLAIDNKLSLWKLRRTMYAYPTYAQVVKKAGDSFFARQLSDLTSDSKKFLLRHAPKLIAAVFWSTLIILFTQYRATNDLSYTDVLLALLDFFTTTMWGPLVYMLLYAIRPLIFFPATLLTALSGVLFGFWWGVFYTVIGENLSANFAYAIGRFFGKDLTLEDSPLGGWVAALRSRPFASVLFMRLFYFPFDLTNYGSGILKINWRSYALATLIGIMPGLTTFVALGAAIDIERFRADGISADIFNPYFLALSAGIFIISLLISRLLKKWHTKGT